VKNCLEKILFLKKVVAIILFEKINNLKKLIILKFSKKINNFKNLTNLKKGMWYRRVFLLPCSH
jgi:hypothetical protein